MVKAEVVDVVETIPPLPDLVPEPEPLPEPVTKPVPEPVVTLPEPEAPKPKAKGPLLAFHPEQGHTQRQCSGQF